MIYIQLGKCHTVIITYVSLRNDCQLNGPSLIGRSTVPVAVREVPRHEVHHAGDNTPHTL